MGVRAVYHRATRTFVSTPATWIGRGLTKRHSDPNLGHLRYRTQEVGGSSPPSSTSEAPQPRGFFFGPYEAGRPRTRATISPVAPPRELQRRKSGHPWADPADPPVRVLSGPQN